MAHHDDDSTTADLVRAGGPARGAEQAEFSEPPASSPDQPDIPANLRAFASRRLLEDDSLIPGYVYHDPTDEQIPPRENGDRASGWCLLVGDEDETELSDPANVMTPSLRFLAERYPSFGVLVTSGARGHEYEWVPGQEQYLDLGPSQPES